MKYIVAIAIMAVLFVVTQSFVKNNRDTLLRVNPYLQSIIFAVGFYVGIILVSLVGMPPPIAAFLLGVSSFAIITYLAFLFVEYLRKVRGGT